MPFTFNGTGTKYYGSRERDIGGTYITTQWIVVLGVPLLPLNSWRVYPRDEGQFHDHRPLVNADASHTTQDFDAKRVPLNWKQVLNVYAVTIPLVALGVWGFMRAFPGLSVKW